MKRFIAVVALVPILAQCVTVIPSYEDDASKPGDVGPGPVQSYQSNSLSLASETVRFGQSARLLMAPAANGTMGGDAMNMAQDYIGLLIEMLSCTRISPEGILQIQFSIKFNQCELMGTMIDGEILADVDLRPASITMSFEGLKVDAMVLSGAFEIGLPSSNAEFDLTMVMGTTTIALIGTMSLGGGGGTPSIVINATGTASLGTITGTVEMTDLQISLAGLAGGGGTADPAACVPPGGTITIVAEGTTLVLRFADGKAYMSIDGSPEEELPIACTGGLIPGIPGITPPPAGP